jgi:hypothetical protein
VILGATLGATLKPAKGVPPMALTDTAIRNAKPQVAPLRTDACPDRTSPGGGATPLLGHANRARNLRQWDGLVDRDKALPFGPDGRRD